MGSNGNGRNAAHARRTSATEQVSSPGLVSWIRGVMGRKSSEQSLKDVLEEVIQEHQEETGEELSTEERVILHNMLSVGALAVHDVMIPRADIVAMEYATPLSELKKVIAEKRVSRIPLYKGNLDRIRGFIHLKDIVPALTGDVPYEVQKVIREILFVSPAMRVVDLLMQMRLSGEHIAIVVDEYGGTDGLVTMEDLFEAIVGEIQDEHDSIEPMDEIRQVGPHTYEAYARLSIERLEEDLGIVLRDMTEVDYDTLGGLIFARLGRVPVRGEIIEIENVGRIDIVEADPRRVRRVRLHLKKPSPSEEELVA